MGLKHGLTLRRRDTSEDSEGCDASGASPKGGTPSGHRRSLRKNPSTNGRHRRPPRRAAGPSGNSPAVRSDIFKINNLQGMAGCGIKTEPRLVVS